MLLVKKKKLHEVFFFFFFKAPSGIIIKVLAPVVFKNILKNMTFIFD